MNAPHNSAQARAWHRRTAAIFAAVGALVFSSGIVMLTAPAASADPAEKVGVCHRKASGSYVFLSVSASSTGEPHGHITHLEGNTGGVGGLPDYIIDSPSVPDGVDTEAELEDWCRGRNTGGGGDPVGTTVPLSDLNITRIAGCGTSGAVAVSETSNDIYYSITGDSWTNLTGDVTVTAELLDPADQFATPPVGEWEITGNTAVWEVHFGPATECLYGTLATPDYTPNAACAAPGSVEAMTDASNVEYMIDGGNWNVTEGNHTITASLINGAVAFSNPTAAGWSVSTDGLTATYPVALGSKIEKCDDANGGGGNQGGGGDNGQNPGGGNTDQPGGNQGGGTPKLVTPKYPSATDATCSRRGALIVPSQPEGVLTTRTGSIPGKVTFTYAPATGYAFPADAATKVTVKVAKKLSGDECVLGDEGSQPTHTSKPTHHAKPKPRDRGPAVLGTQAAVPTAVDAGLASLPTTSVSSTGSPRLAQALVAGGLLMLVAGGSMGLGRRTRGAHES